MHLFKKDIFSVKDPLFSKLNNQDKTEIAAIIKRYYPDLFIKEIYKIGAFEINSNNWKIISDRATFILKRANLNKLESLSAQAQWTVQLEQSSFPTLRFLKNKEGRLISRDEYFVYCITYFEEGQYFGSSSEQWPDLIANKKKLFDYSLQDNSFSSLSIPSRDFFTSEEKEFIATLKSYPEIHNVSRLQLVNIIEEFEKVQSFFKTDQLKFNKRIYHVDVHPHNLIFNNNKLILFTDFESFQLTFLEVSLGFGLYKCLRQLLALQEDQHEQNLLDRVVILKAQFQLHFPDHNFIELISIARIDVLKRILYILKELYDNGQSQWLFVLQAQLVSLEEINELKRIVS